MKLVFDKVALHYHYDELPLLKEVSFELNGNNVGVYLSSQSGKTSLLRMLVENVLPTSGNIFLNDTNIKEISHKDRSIKYLSSKPILFEGKSVEYNIRYVMKLRNIVDDALFDSVILKYELTDKLRLKVKKLSLYEQYCVVLARLDMWQADLLVVDDFTSNPSDVAKLLENYILGSNTSKLIVSSDINAFNLVDNVCVIDGGKTIVFSKKEEAVDEIKKLNSFLIDIGSFDMKDSIALSKHKQWKGKWEIKLRCEVDTCEQLSVAYTPGVADPCLEIARDSQLSYTYTRRGNLVAVVSDGSAVLGLGNIGGLAGMPVMEGKAILFKQFADVDCIPIVLSTQDTDEIINTVVNIAPSFGGINLEDIASPRCFEVEERLKELLDIPVFHDDQHGTAIVVLAGVINACKLTNRKMSQLKVVVNGAGAAGTAIAKLLINSGVDDCIMVDKSGIIVRSVDYDESKNKLAKITNKFQISGSLKDAIVNADVFVGVSVANCLSEEMVSTMNKNAIVFAMANPIPEIMPDVAKRAGIRVIGTGRSDFPNQINNVLAFPGVFRGALDSKATKITEGMKLVAAYAIADLITDKELNDEYVIPSPFDTRVAKAVAKAVATQAIKEGCVRK